MDIYCIDHLIPEKHNCPYITPQQWKDQPIKTVIPEEPIPQRTIEPEIKPTIEKQEKYISKTTTETEKPKINKKRSLKLIGSLTIIIILITIASIGAFLMLQQNYLGLNDEKQIASNMFFGPWNGTIEGSPGSFNVIFSYTGSYSSTADTNYIPGFIYADNSSGSWELKEGKMVTHPNSGETEGTFSCQFFDNNHTLNLTQTDTGYHIHLIKQGE